MAKKCECFMANHVKLATKSNKFMFKSLDECLTNSYSMCTYLKGQYNNNKRRHTGPTKLVPIMFVELKIKREKDKDLFLKALFNSGASTALVNLSTVRHIKKTVTKSTLFSTAAGNFPTHGKCLVKLRFPEFNPTAEIIKLYT